MKILPLSSKYQVVIPKEARKKLGITRSTRGMYIKRVTKDEIVLAKAPDLKQWMLELLNSTPKTHRDVVADIRKLRDEWDERAK